MEYTNEIVLVKTRKVDVLSRFVRKNKFLVWCVGGIVFFSALNFCLLFKFFDLLKML